MLSLWVSTRALAVTTLSPMVNIFLSFEFGDRLIANRLGPLGKTSPAKISTMFECHNGHSVIALKFEIRTGQTIHGEIISILPPPDSVQQWTNIHKQNSRLIFLPPWCMKGQINIPLTSIHYFLPIPIPVKWIFLLGTDTPTHTPNLGKQSWFMSRINRWHKLFQEVTAFQSVPNFSISIDWPIGAQRINFKPHN